MTETRVDVSQEGEHRGIPLEPECLNDRNKYSKDHCVWAIDMLLRPLPPHNRVQVIKRIVHLYNISL